MAVSTIKGDERGERAVYGEYCRVKRIGNVVEIWGTASDYSIGRSYTDLTTLPQWCRPSHVVHGTGNSVGGNNEVLVHVTTGGIVQLYASATTTYWEYDITYLVD